MLISELHNITPIEPVRARLPIKIAEGSVNEPKLRLREFLLLQELTGHLKKALGQ